MDQVVRLMFSLHFAIMVETSRAWLYLILGLGGIFLYSGNLLWLNRVWNGKKILELVPPKQRV